MTGPATGPHLADELLQALASGFGERPPHLDGCPRCQGELAIWGALSLGLAQVARPELPPAFEAQLARRLAAAREPWAWVGGAVALAALLALALLSRRPSELWATLAVAASQARAFGLVLVELSRLGRSSWQLPLALAFAPLAALLAATLAALSRTPVLTWRS